MFQSSSVSIDKLSSCFVGPPLYDKPWVVGLRLKFSYTLVSFVSYVYCVIELYAFIMKTGLAVFLLSFSNYFDMKLHTSAFLFYSASKALLRASSSFIGSALLFSFDPPTAPPEFD